MQSAETLDYMMENPEEGERLSIKVNPEELVKKYVTPIITSPKDILDVGCGAGNITAFLAKTYAQANVIGLDGSPERIEQAKTLYSNDNLSFVNNQAVPLPYNDNAFDLVFSRFMLEYFPDPTIALKEMMRVCKPGGKILIQEIDMQYSGNYPEDDWPSEEVKNILSGLRQAIGFDGFIGRKLHHYMHQIGLNNIQVSIDGYNVFAGKISDDDLRDRNLEFDALFPAVSKILKSESLAQQVRKKMTDYFLKDNTFSFSLLFSVVGTKS